jgi:hypothetical protein
MTGVSRGRTICLSTPFGQRGYFWKEWYDESAKWQRFRVPWQRCPRLTAEFIAEERRKFGDSWISQEYECSFTSMEGLVYPNFAEQTEYTFTAPPGRHVGGMDFGFRNPFAAIWGTLNDDVLYLDHEIYVRETPLSTLASRLPRNVTWYADPAGAQEIEELRVAGFTVRKGKNDIRPGIAAVTARLQSGRLRINRFNCPNIISEAKLYRYPSPAERPIIGENPVDSDNHALGALRYVISRIDAKAMSKYRNYSNPDDRPPERDPLEAAEAIHAPKRRGIDLKNPDIWTTL